MRKIWYIALFACSLVIVYSCGKDKEESSQFELLTGSVWLSDSLLVNGTDASAPGQMLANFKGEARFNEDGSGTFGNYMGTWRFAQRETELVIQSDSLPLPLSTKILLLTRDDLKVSTSFPDITNMANPPLQIRLTFKAK
jgi:hypothetical protein